MSQSTPPSQPAEGNPYAGQPTDGNPYAAQQPTGGNPFAQQPAGGNPFAGQQPGFVPPAPPAPRRGNVTVGIVAAVVAALVTAVIYGVIIGKTEHEIGYAAIGVGFVVGFAAGKLGGSNPVLPVVSAVISLGAIYAGQLTGYAVWAADETGTSVTTIFTEQFSVLTDVWKEGADAMTFLFLAIGAFAAFSGAKKAAD
ncbi:hypothetical protein ACFS5L_12865 [Streptomyces phyllanthi]|uniref:Uncharacterized protein n=1 Tax=Streptomyces phyllanthi TaxID=1803180 RepID=A0A5N8W0U2_9ACTN|nr:hypothetical protein [Streptomyces phyllanthi]MPY41127.1 hypothetical protein [Streptomyces phyllanthi]